MSLIEKLCKEQRALQRLFEACKNIDLSQSIIEQAEATKSLAVVRF